MEGSIMYRIIHTEPFNDEIVALLDSSAMSETDFLSSALAKDYSLDVSSTYVNGIKNKNILFELIGRFSSDPADKVCQIMLNLVKNNLNEFKTHCKMALNLKGCTGEQWVQYMESNEYVNDELCLFILGKLYFHHATVVNKYNLWTTVATSVRINKEALLKLSSIRLLYMGKQTFGILNLKPRLVMQRNINRQPGYARNSLPRGRATRPYNVQPLYNQPMANSTRQMPSFLNRPSVCPTVPYIVQPRYNQPQACSTRQMSLPQTFGTPSPTYTPSRYHSSSTGRPAIRPQVYPRHLQQQPPYHHTTSSSRGIQSVIPTHTVPMYRIGLMNPNRVQGIRPRVNAATHTWFNDVVTGSTTPHTLQTQNSLPSVQTMSPEVSQLLQTLQSKNSTRNTEIPTIDLVDTDGDSDTEQCTTRATNDSHVESTATAISPIPGTCAIDESQIHCSESIDLENNSLHTTVAQEDTSSNIISINPVSGNKSDDDSTNELLDELNIDLKDLTSANKAPEINTTVNVIHKAPIVAETSTCT